MAISSALGVGSTIRIWLPVAEAAASEPLPSQRDEEPRTARLGRQPRVLLVDDDATVREVLAETLEAAGLLVRTAASGEEALRLLEPEHSIDVLVSDLSMPDMDGMMVIREAQRRRHGLPAILLTGFADDASQIAAGDVGDGSFTLLRKPTSGREISDHVALLLEGAMAKANRPAAYAEASMSLPDGLQTTRR